MGVTEHYHIYLSFSNKRILVVIQHQIKSKYSTSENYRWQGKFFNARLFFVVLGVQNWVPIEHGHIYRIINTSDNTTQYEINPSHFGRENYLNASLFVLLFVLLLFFRFSFFFWGGGQGVGVGFVFWGWGGGGWNTVQRDVNAIHRTSECYSWQRKFDRRWFVCFVLFVCFVFCVFYFIFIIFSGEGVGLAFLGVVDGV